MLPLSASLQSSGAWKPSGLLHRCLKRLVVHLLAACAKLARFLPTAVFDMLLGRSDN